MTYILTHEYSDRSGFTICGVTELRKMAECWFNANDENNVYFIQDESIVKHWMEGYESWKGSNVKSRPQIS